MNSLTIPQERCHRRQSDVSITIKSDKKSIDKEENGESKKDETIVYCGEVLPAKPDKVVYKKNNFGNFEMKETRFVMDTESKTIVGVQESTGTIRSLNDKEKVLCEAWNLKSN